MRASVPYRTSGRTSERTGSGRTNEWAGGSALAEAEAGGRVSHGSRHASQLLFEAPRSSLGAAYNASRLRRASPLCAFVVADRRSRRVGLISRVFDQNAGVSCLR